jgi:ABC-2 type transport system permease protein
MRTELTVAWLTARQLLARRRAAPVVLLTLLPVVIAAIAASRGDADLTRFAVLLNDRFIIRVVLPVIALILGTGAFGAEREEGTGLYLLTKPVARWRIALAKLVTVAVLTTILAAGASALTSLVLLRGNADGITTAFIAAVALGSVLYAAVFLTLGLFLRRALPAGLIYVLVWEVAAADMFAGTRALSIRQYVLSVADRLATFDPALLQAQLSSRTALIMSGVVLLLSATLAVLRLRSYEVLDQQ